MSVGDPFLLGVNYWPRRKAMYWWADFDAEEVRQEFALIRDFGLTHVRFFLLWESFQPAPDLIDPAALKHLRTVCDIAAELDLKLEPTFFTGHMSGPNWAPDWLVSPFPRRDDERQLVSLTRHIGSPHTIYNIYTEPFVIEAAELQLRTICPSLRDHPAIWAWSLGNEPDLFCQPPNPDSGKRWADRMVRVIKSVDPNHPVLIGLHAASLDYEVGFHVDQIAEVTDLSVMHGYSIYSPLARRPLDPDYVPFTCALTSALAGRPVLYEEFGLCTHVPDRPSGFRDMVLPYGKKHRQWFSSEEDGAEYYRQVLPRLQRVGALGAFAWCFADYDRSLWDKPPCDYVIHERFFGLFRADGTPKPAALAIRDFAATNPKVRAPEKTVILPVAADVYYHHPQTYVPTLYEKFGRIV
jgi:endo-1,4-beta-mannosidase